VRVPKPKPPSAPQAKTVEEQKYEMRKLREEYENLQLAMAHNIKHFRELEESIKDERQECADHHARCEAEWCERTMAKCQEYERIKEAQQTYSMYSQGKRCMDATYACSLDFAMDNWPQTLRNMKVLTITTRVVGKEASGSNGLKISGVNQMVLTKDKVSKQRLRSCAGRALCQMVQRALLTRQDLCGSMGYTDEKLTRSI